MANNKNYKSHKELLRFYDDIKSGLHKDEDSVWQQSGKMLNAETYKRIKNKKVRDLIEKKDREKFINDA